MNMQTLLLKSQLALSNYEDITKMTNSIIVSYNNLYTQFEKPQDYKSLSANLSDMK